MNKVGNTGSFAIGANVITLFLFIFLTMDAFSQKESRNAVGISVPVVWNNSSGVYYSLGNRREPSGKATSYGININYSHFVYKNLFVIGGIGYYKQRFNIQRPFQYTAPDGTRPLVSTTKYYYQNIHVLAGLGYQKKVSNKWSVGGQLSYNMYSSFSQEYKQEYLPGDNEVTKKKFVIGNMINLDIKCERYVNNRVSIGGAIVVPFYTHWKNDIIFVKYDYADDTQTIAQSKFSVGANLSIYFQLKK